MRHQWLQHAGARATVCAFAVALLLPSPVRAADPCALLTPAEIAAVTGAPVSAMKPSGPGMCAGTAPGFDVLLRLAERRESGTEMEDAGMAAIRKMGGQVDVRTFGTMTCSTLVPPPSLLSMGFNTTCSLRRNGWVAAVEVTAKTRQSQIPIEKLRPLAEKMASRF